MFRLIIIMVFAISSFSVVNKIFSLAEKWLDVDNTIDAELLIVEAWLPDYLTKNVIEEFRSKNYKKLLITGNIKFDCLSLWDNGSIIIAPAWEKFHTDSLYQVCILTKGTPVKKQYPVVELYLDSIRIDVFNAESEIAWHCTDILPLTDHAILEYRYVNDYVSGHEDRNLFFYSLKINDSLIPYTSNMITITNSNFYNLLTANYFSDASEKALIFKNAGIPKDYISFIQADTTTISRTLSSAAVAIQYMHEYDYHSANIFTTDFHSRRSYKSYAKLAGKKLQIGVISEPVNSYIRKRMIIKECLKITALSFIPRFYINRKFRKLGLMS